jgi:hypothetical protein
MQAITPSSFQELHRRATAWAETESAKTLQFGAPLNELGLQTARLVGVRCPENIRIKYHGTVPFPPDIELEKLMISVGMPPGQIDGMTLHYGINIKKDQIRHELLRHEFRHVSQFEHYGSISAFMEVYLTELIEKTYGPGSLEQDAKHAETHDLPPFEPSKT